MFRQPSFYVDSLALIFSLHLFNRSAFHFSPYGMKIFVVKIFGYGKQIPLLSLLRNEFSSGSLEEVKAVFDCEVNLLGKRMGFAHWTSEPVKESQDHDTYCILYSAHKLNPDKIVETIDKVFFYPLE